MTRQRKEIYRQLNEISLMRAADDILSCGHGVYLGEDDPYEKREYELESQLAGTYGMSLEEWFGEGPVGRAFSNGLVPFN